MNTISVSQIHYFFAISLGIHHIFREFTINFANLPWIHYEITMISLSASRFHYEYTIFSRKRYLFREFSITNSLCNEFSITNSISLFRKFTILSRLYYLFTICFAILLGIHHLFREFTIRFANSPWIHCSATMIHYLLRVSLWIHYLFREFTICIVISLWILYLFSESTLNSLFFAKPLLIRYEITMTSLWIHYRFRVITIKSYLYREFTIHQKSFSWIRIESTFFPRIISELTFTILFA